MVTEEVINAIPPELLVEIARLNFFIQALGGILIFYIIFNLINLFLNRKKNAYLKEIYESTKEIKDLLKNSRKSSR